MMPKDVIASDTLLFFSATTSSFLDSPHILIFIFSTFQIACSLAPVVFSQLSCRLRCQLLGRGMLNRLVIPYVASRLPVHLIFQVANDQSHGWFHVGSLCRFCYYISGTGVSRHLGLQVSFLKRI